MKVQIGNHGSTSIPGHSSVFHSRIPFHYNHSMFRLTDAVLERIIFAMEDQARLHLIDMETGQLVSRQEVAEHGKTLSCVEPPPWSAHQGFRLLEAFCVTVPDQQARRELAAILRNGKGVFKAFKAALDRYPVQKLRFREFKLHALRPLIERWMLSLEHTSRLEVLDEAPEDLTDLINSEFATCILPASSVPFNLPEVVEQLLADAPETWDPLLCNWASSRLQRRLIHLHAGLLIAYAYIESSDPAAIACFSMESSEAASRTDKSTSVAVVHAMLVRKDCFTCSLEWRMLQDIEEYALSANAGAVIIEAPLLASSVLDEADEHGYFRTGGALVRMLSREAFDSLDNF
ncbi:MAG: hypothetical protein QHH01_03425 [Spirochaetales bacterium]|nr:hypothetical protein [Spirochaetales bacterium]